MLSVCIELHWPKESTGSFSRAAAHSAMMAVRIALAAAASARSRFLHARSCAVAASPAASAASRAALFTLVERFDIESYSDFSSK